MTEYPTVDDLWFRLDGRVTIDPNHDHPTAGPLQPPIGFVWENEKGEFAWCGWDERNTPRDQWSVADTRMQAAEELLSEHLVAWQHEFDRATEMETYNQRPTYGRGFAA